MPNPSLGFLLLLVFSLNQASAQISGAITVPPDYRESYPVHSVSFADGVTGLPDVVYASYSGYRPLTLDIYLPPRHDKPVPLVIYIHGGSMKAANARLIIGIRDVPATLARLAARGYVVASLNYRLRNEAVFPAQVQDVKAAIGYLRTHASTHGIDPARLLVWGASSGGQLAALTAMSCGMAEFAPKPSDGHPMPAEVAAVAGAHPSDCVQGAISWYGSLELSQEAKNPDTQAMLGCNPCSASQIAAADPITYASSSAPPMLIVHGTADQGVSITQSQNMARRLAALKVPIETLYIPGVGHGFVGETPEATRAANDKALQRSFDFIDKLFSGGRQ